MAQQGDPGYKSTAVLLGECGLALATDRDALSERRGVLTPVAAMGDVAADPATGCRGVAGDDRPELSWRNMNRSACVEHLWDKITFD